MPSPRTIVLATAAVLVSLASADYIIDPESVPKTTRQWWCQDQKSTCPILCQQVEPGTTLVNTCDPDALRYGCLCGNNQQPNMSEYTLTLPYWTCTAWVQQCQKKCGDHANDCISACAQDHPCGATNPTRLNVSSTTSATTVSPTSSPTGDAIFTGPNGATDDDDSGNGGDGGSGAAALDAGRRFGLGVLVGSLLLGFGMVA